MEYQELTPEQKIEAEREKAKIKTEVERIEKSITIGEALRTLMEDENYKKVFTEFYLKDEVIRETMLLSEQYFLEKDQRMSLQDGLLAKAHFNDWTKSMVSMDSLSRGRLIEHANRLRELDQLLDNGIPNQQEVLPPEGVNNG